jgi:hypothetical protein
MAETHQFDAARLFSVEGFVCVVTGGGVSPLKQPTSHLAAANTSATDM